MDDLRFFRYKHRDQVLRFSQLKALYVSYIVEKATCNQIIIIFSFLSKVTQLKIDNNPFAKGFRDNFDRLVTILTL